MNFERFTQRSREAVDRAQRLAREHAHQELRPEHLLAALAAEEGGTVQAVLQKLGVRPADLAAHAAFFNGVKVQGAPSAEALNFIVDQFLANKKTP